MALITCPECNELVSEFAAQCPKCAAPIAKMTGHTPTGVDRVKSTTNGCLSLVVLLVLIVVAIPFFRGCALSSVSPKMSAVETNDPPAAVATDNASAKQAAVQKFSGLPSVREANWVRPTEFWVLVDDNGKSWDAVADQACVWIRAKGFSGRFSVSIMDASAALNKRTKQLAHAGCS